MRNPVRPASWRWLVAVAVLALGGVILFGGPAGTPARVVGVVDGDTVEIVWSKGRDVVRILGVDTPETVHPERPVECFGPEATAFTETALDGRQVVLRFDRERRDRYGRLLAYVEADGRDVSTELLRRGLARFLVIPPNGRSSRPLLEAELAARHAGRGLWSACPGPN